jgi:hypothetical protein
LLARRPTRLEADFQGGHASGGTLHQKVDIFAFFANIFAKLIDIACTGGFNGLRMAKESTQSVSASLPVHSH